MTKPELEWWILFGICVAGKSAKQTQAKLEAMLRDPEIDAGSPFQRIDTAIRKRLLGRLLRKHKMGKYALFNKAFRAAIQINLDTVSVESLEKVPGIGPKTARMVAMYGFPDTSGDVAVLDTHVLKWLRAQGYDAPKSTPTGRRYLELEKAFIEEARRRGKTVRELDTSVWNQFAKK